MSSSAQQSSQETHELTRINIDRKANEVVHLLLVWEQRKIPIKRADINKHVLKEHKSIYSDVMKNVCRKLQDVFGMKLLEIGEGSKKSYILVSLLDHTDTEDLIQWKGRHKRGLLVTILALIFMSGNQIIDAVIFGQLYKFTFPFSEELLSMIREALKNPGTILNSAMPTLKKQFVGRSQSWAQVCDLVVYAIRKQFSFACSMQMLAINLCNILEGFRKQPSIYLTETKISGSITEQAQTVQLLINTYCGIQFSEGNNNCTLWNTLKKLGIEKDKSHPVFGEVKKVLQEFQRQMYLEVTKLPNSDPPQFKYCWGLRANHEITKRKILEFVTMLYNKSDITVWKSQYQDMIAEEHAQQAT